MQEYQGVITFSDFFSDLKKKVTRCQIGPLRFTCMTGVGEGFVVAMVIEPIFRASNFTA